MERIGRGETQDVVAVRRFLITTADKMKPWFGKVHTQNVSKRVLDLLKSPISACSQ